MKDGDLMKELEYLCDCDCGNTVLVKTSDLPEGNIQNCGMCDEKLNSAYLRKLAEDLIGEDAKTIWCIVLMSAEELDKECSSELWGNTRYWPIHKCSEVYLANSMEDKKVPDEFIMKTYIHELAHVRMNAQGKPDHKHGKEFNRVHREIKQTAKKLGLTVRRNWRDFGKSWGYDHCYRLNPLDSFTVDIYGHLISGSTRAAANRLDDYESITAEKGDRS